MKRAFLETRESEQDDHQIKQWLEGLATAAKNTIVSEIESQLSISGFVTHLHHSCAIGLRDLSKDVPIPEEMKTCIMALADEADRLFLWGEAFEGEKLDQAVNFSHDIRISVLESLFEIGKVILQGKSYQYP